jgi:two-component system nitrate/nitrite sensor histidine kinase NarX
VRHSGAHRIHVRLEYWRFDVTLSVADDGRGFDVARTQQPNGHYGLVMMKERAAELGGTLQIIPRSGGGTEIRAVVPQAAVGVEETADVGA